MSHTFTPKLYTIGILDQIGTFNKYAGRGHDAATTIQERYNKYRYRKQFLLGSGIIREDLEQVHGFFRTLIFGSSIENRNLFALRILRQHRAKTLALKMMDQIIVYCGRIPVDDGAPITTRALNGAFKVKFICEALAGMPATRWDEEAGRWSSEFETDDALDLLITSLHPYDSSLPLRDGFAQSCRYTNWSMVNPVFQQYIRALTYICRQPEYHSEEWERLLKTWAPNDDEMICWSETQVNLSSSLWTVDSRTL